MTNKLRRDTTVSKIVYQHLRQRRRYMEAVFRKKRKLVILEDDAEPSSAASVITLSATIKPEKEVKTGTSVTLHSQLSKENDSTKDVAPESVDVIEELASVTTIREVKGSIPASLGGDCVSWLLVHLREPSWKAALATEFQQPYFRELASTLWKQFIACETWYPNYLDVFTAFNLCPFSSVKVVILGQEPYYDDGQSHGLAYSFKGPVSKMPIVLANVFKELQQDLGVKRIGNRGCNLSGWAEQGVLLLNTVLTVKKKEPKSHVGLGWEQFTRAVLQTIIRTGSFVVVLLWGNEPRKVYQSLEVGIGSRQATQQAARVPSGREVLYSGHPFLMDQFSGNKAFSKANIALKTNGLSIVHWDL